MTHTEIPKGPAAGRLLEVAGNSHPRQMTIRSLLADEQNSAYNHALPRSAYNGGPGFVFPGYILTSSTLRLAWRPSGVSLGMAGLVEPSPLDVSRAPSIL